MAAREVSGGMITQAQAERRKAISPAERMRKAASSVSIQEILANSLKENAGAFTASIIELYSSDNYLQNCEAGAVVREALKAVSLKLPINKQLGFAYIIPRRNKGIWEPGFQLGYKGYIQLAMRTGAYKFINAGEVYEGELAGQDKLTGRIDLSGEAVSDKVIGYFAYIETLNGFSKTLYWSREKLIRHVETYSDSYKNGAAIWKKNFTEMAVKTVLKYLLSHWGVLSVEMLDAMSAEEDGVLGMADEATGSLPPEEENGLTEPPIEAEGREVSGDAEG